MPSPVRCGGVLLQAQGSQDAHPGGETALRIKELEDAIGSTMERVGPVEAQLAQKLEGRKQKTLQIELDSEEADRKVTDDATKKAACSKRTHGELAYS